MKKTKSAYLKYLKSDHWQRLRAMALSRDRYRCVRCSSGSCLEVHHKWYRDVWEDAELIDLETLCSVCHGREHEPVNAPVTPRTITGHVKSRRWNMLGQLVNRNGKPYTIRKRRKRR